jgi:PAS domain S-box-containing protein
MNKTKGTPGAPERILGPGANGSQSKNGARKNPAPVFQYPKTELEAAIRRYVELYEFAPIGYVSLDRVGRIEEINLAAVQLLGRPRHRLVGSPFARFVTKSDAQLFLRHVHRCRSAEHRLETELRLKTPRGGTVPVQLSSVPIHSLLNGKLLYQTAIVDLTERKRAEHSIRQSELRYRTLFDFVPVAVYTCDAEGLIQEYNQNAVELWGREPKTNDPKESYCGSFKIFYPDGRPMPHEKCPMARVLHGERLKASDLEIVVERNNGARRHVLVNPTALKNERGKIIGAINCLHDITERKRTENALRESEERSRAMLHQSGAGIVGSDLAGRVIFVNRKLCQMLGYAESELLGKGILEITHSAEKAESRRLFQRIVKNGEPYEIEKRYLRKDGSSLWVSVSASPMRDAVGKTQAAVAVVLDVAERKKAQALLEERARGLEGEILEISDREQQRLGQDLHDSLCQHLAATAFMVRSMAMRLKNHRVLDVDDLERIAELINEGVTEARTVARGLHPVEMESTGLMTALQSLVGQKHWPVLCRFEADEEISIPDATVALHLYRIAREAVINASKHAGAREIIVELRDRKKGIELSVTDDGKGVKASDMRKRTGMGFHIMEYRARSIGAQLLIERVKPRGTCVTCRLPRQ